jgi:hypothetical protein
LRLATSVGENCSERLVPSAALTNTVWTLAERARATIAGTLPPSDLLRYQIHIERPWTGTSDAPADPAQGTARALRTSATRSDETTVLAVLASPSDKCSPADACLPGT